MPPRVVFLGTWGRKVSMKRSTWGTTLSMFGVA
jgi:hypothetical protein